jgi:hypothetical protein
MKVNIRGYKKELVKNKKIIEIKEFKRKSKKLNENLRN